MSKFMLFMLLPIIALLSGCATDNPYARNAQVIGGTVAGAVIGYKTLKGGVLGGLAGAVIGHEVTKAAQWRPGDDEIEVVTVPSGSGGYAGGYSSCGAVSVHCDTTPKQGMYPPRPGMCNDPDSGGVTTYEDLVRRAQRRAGCYDNAGYQAPQHQHQYSQRHASYAPAQNQVVYPSNLWEHPEKRQKTAEVKKEEPYDGPTINDYMSPRWASVIPGDCRTGNYGRDSNCLYAEADKLKVRQEACEVNSKKCAPGFNFGQMAWYDRKLAGDLRRAQDKYK